MLNIPAIKQRLIFQGKLLQSNEKLSLYKITDDNVIHLVAKTLDESTGDNQQQSQNQSHQNQDHRVNLDDVLNGIIEIPIIRSNRRSRRRRSKLCLNFSTPF